MPGRPDWRTCTVGGVWYGLTEVAQNANRDKATAGIVNQIASDDSSVARGARYFTRMCVPCHGAGAAGDGPVAALFMPPPDLLAEPTRNRTDGFIFSYIRHGGGGMPPHGQNLAAPEAGGNVQHGR